LELFHALTPPLYSDPILVRVQGLDTLERDLRQQALRRLEAIAEPTPCS
jgi:hypothetical protein